MIQKDQLRRMINEVLVYIGYHTPSAEELLMLTAATESRFGTYIFQLRGPARGIFQMEPFTENDCWNHYLRFLRTPLPAKIKSLMMDGMDNLTYNIAYQIAMSRVRYLRVKSPIPDADDIVALATYWKQHYNTHLGKGTVEKALQDYERYVRL
jgi:hypothetical protein